MRERAGIMAITVSKEFKAAFNLCMKHYECTAEEIEFEKQRVRANYRDAERCYLSIAAEILEKEITDAKNRHS